MAAGDTSLYDDLYNPAGAGGDEDLQRRFRLPDPLKMSDASQPAPAADVSGLAQPDYAASLSGWGLPAAPSAPSSPDTSPRANYVEQNPGPANYVQPSAVPTSRRSPDPFNTSGFHGFGGSDVPASGKSSDAPAKRLPFSVAGDAATFGYPQTVAGSKSPGLPSGAVAPPSSAPPVPPAYNPTDLYADQRKYGTPLDVHDPKYRMGIGQRLLGTVANFTSGFGAAKHGGSPSLIYVGPGATNHLYDQDNAAREANLANTNTQIASGRDLAEENRKGYVSAVQGEERAALGRAADARGAAATQNAETKANAILKGSERRDPATGKWSAQNGNGDTVEVGEPAWYGAQQSKNPQVKMAAERQARIASFESLPPEVQAQYTQMERASYIVGGKLPPDHIKAQSLQLREAQFGFRRQQAAAKAQGKGSQGGQWFVTSGENQEFKQRTGALDKEETALTKKRASYVGRNDQYSKQAVSGIDNRLAMIKQQRAGVQQSIIDKRPAAPAGGGGAPAPAARPPAGGAAPRPPQKVATKADVADFATRKGMTTDAVEKQLRAEGYIIQ